MKDSEIEDVIDLIKKSKKILVFTGAGISTNCGIPDFRSENGLYNLVSEFRDLPYPEAIFELDYFVENPRYFFDLSRELFIGDVEPSICHEFLAWLEKEGKVSLLVTQNIDMLHTSAGSEKVLECHGSYHTAHCLNCGKKYYSDEYSNDVLDGIIPKCECGGIIKPDVVFFEESLPYEFYDLYENPPKFDLVLILGSSLVVEPAAHFATRYLDKIPSVIVNLDPTRYDDEAMYILHQDLDDFAKEVWDALKK